MDYFVNITSLGFLEICKLFYKAFFNIHQKQARAILRHLPCNFSWFTFSSFQLKCLYKISIQHFKTWVPLKSHT